jgi:hypothetical protein
MPRICTSRNDPMDFCIKCFPKTEAIAKKRFGNIGDGPDGRGNCFAYEAEHPNYEYEDEECLVCFKLLTIEDN